MKQGFLDYDSREGICACAGRKCVDEYLGMGCAAKARRERCHAVIQSRMDLPEPGEDEEVSSAKRWRVREVVMTYAHDEGCESGCFEGKPGARRRDVLVDDLQRAILAPLRDKG